MVGPDFSVSYAFVEGRGGKIYFLDEEKEADEDEEVTLALTLEKKSISFVWCLVLRVVVF